MFDGRNLGRGTFFYKPRFPFPETRTLIPLRQSTLHKTQSMGRMVNTLLEIRRVFLYHVPFMAASGNSGPSPYAMNPFPTADQRNIVRRHRETIQFVAGREWGNTLDIGERNPLTERLEQAFGINITNTTGDLDLVQLQGTYDTICCFEVVEHLMNPLHVMMQISKVLAPDGVCFLSTPIHKPHFLWDQFHFTEYDQKRLLSLLQRAGFHPLRSKIFRTMPAWWYLTGIRPFLRFFFNNVIILELRKT